MRNTWLLLALMFIPAFVFAQFPNVRVDDPNSYSPNETSIAINRLDPGIVCAGSNLNYLYRSLDSGATWAQSELTSMLGVWGDPCLIFDKLGNLYFGHLSNPVEGYWIDRIVVQKSTDYGLTWNDGAGVGYNYPKVQDKEWLCADYTESIYQNNVYMSWTEFDSYGSTSPSDSTRILFSRSTDAGETWGAPVRLSDIGGDCWDSGNTVEGAVPCVGPNGEVYVAWSGPEGIQFDRSFDGGVTFGNDIFVDSHPGGWDYNIPGIYRANGMPVTVCDISNSPHRGRIYIMWGQLPSGTNNSDVYLRYSDDQGQTWSDRVRINNDNTTRHQFFPWITVDEKTGNVYCVFYDRRNTTGNNTDVFLAKSENGGESFVNFKISESSFLPQVDVFFGDYSCIDSYDGIVRPIWTRGDGQVLSVYTVAIIDSLIPTGVEENSSNSIPEGYRLFQNYPNPFNPSTTISYSIPEEAFVTVKVYDILGKEVAMLENSVVPAGIHEVTFETEGSSSIAGGVYIYRITAGSFTDEEKMVLLR